jgi:hypothetical protein
MLIILITAFFSYEEFSVVDITSFAVLTFVSSLVVIVILYQLALRVSAKILMGKNNFIIYPVLLIAAANLPVYIIICLKTGELYGKDEALLFTLFYLTTALVFGLCTAWKNRKLIKN